MLDITFCQRILCLLNRGFNSTYLYCTSPPASFSLHVLKFQHTLLTVVALVRPWTEALVALPQVYTLSSVLARHVQAAVPVAAAMLHINGELAQPFLWHQQLPVNKHVPHAANEWGE